MYKKTLSVLLIILSLIISGSSFAGTKFINKDTARDRKNNVFGTSNGKRDITIKSDSNSNTMSVKPREKEQNQNQNVGPIFVVPEIKP
ncbi:hypothetical protein [Maridesulfovibrio zosterae]|uniref:hypothetical protein n=1 Tax=Maridesulfovibrio zosterae TaxID=82171 RepID=UPI00041B1FCF|nr:hypothetical protein [Maridesulfovibrio zosterae]